MEFCNFCKAPIWTICSLKTLNLGWVAFHSLTFQMKCLDFRSNQYKKLAPVLSRFCNGLLRFNFFPHQHNFFKKIGIDTHPIDLSCHEKFEKKITDRKRKYWRTKLDIWKNSLSTSSHFTHARSCSCNRVTTPAKPTAFNPDDIFFRWIVLRVTRKATNIGWGGVLPFALLQ